MQYDNLSQMAAMNLPNDYMIVPFVLCQACVQVVRLYISG